MPAHTKSKSAPTEASSSKSAKLTKHVSEESSSEEESPVTTQRPAKAQSPKSVKNVSKAALDSSSSSEAESPAPLKRKPHTSRPDIICSDSDEEDMIPPPKKQIPPPKAKKTQKPAAKKTTGKEETTKKRKNASPKKQSKNSKKAVESEDEIESDDDASLATPEKLRAARKEKLSDEDMMKLTSEELEKKAKQCKTYLKWYEKEYGNVEEKEPWEQASDLMRDAAASISKHKGLENTKFKPGKDGNPSQLIKAVPKLLENGEESYKKAIAIIATLDKEALDRFYNDPKKGQIRNINAKCFEDLITKKEHEKRLLRAQIEKEIRGETENNKDEEDDE